MDLIQLITAPIEKDMDEYTRVFDSYMVHSNLLLNEVLKKIGSRKGKMMRPLLALLAARLLGEVSEKSIYTAATVEFFHTASLIHDDIVDESDSRRGLASVNFTYGNKVAVLIGDFLLANSLLCSVKTGNTRLVEIISIAAQNLADGELLQLDNVKNTEISEDIYYHIIRNKTAALFAACAEGGALSVGASESDIERLKSFGEIVGMCFQIRDDIFDYEKDSRIGKPYGNDMKEGKLTLPLIHVLFKMKDEEMFKIAYRIKEGNVTDDEIERIVEFTKINGGIDYAKKVMGEYAERAKALLSVYPDSDVKQSLISYVDYSITRYL